MWRRGAIGVGWGAHPAALGGFERVGDSGAPTTQPHVTHRVKRVKARRSSPKVQSLGAPKLKNEILEKRAMSTTYACLGA